MRRGVLVLLLLAACGVVPVPAPAQSGGAVADIRVHGNYRTADADVLRLAGLTLGQPLPAGGVETVAGRLKKTGLFVHVEVRRLFRSFDETGDIAVVIIVSEIPGSVIDVRTGPPNPFRRLGNAAMFSPVIDYTDAYGFTVGARASFVHVLGKEGRLSVPLTWGGRKQAALEADKAFASGVFSRIAAVASITSRENPAFRIDDVRREFGGEAIVPLRRRLVSLGLTAGWTDVHFGDVREQFTSYGARIALDTRRNPSFPRNAVSLGAGWRVFDREAGVRVNRYRLDAQGYLGLIGSTVLAVRATSETSDRPLPAYEKALAGGASTLRGFRAGSFAGDNLATGTAELRLPTHSPMRLGQSGFTIFADAAAAYDHGSKLAKATWHYGVGAGWYLRAPLINLNLDVGYGIDRGARAHVSAGLRF